MIVAICFEKGRVGQHFGHTEEFKIYDVKEGKKEVEYYYVKTQGEGCSALVPILKTNKVNVLVCGGLGQGAYNHLIEAGIIVVPGVEGEVDDVFGQLMEGSLKYGEGPNCDHHDEGHECHHEEGEEHHCHHDDDEHKCCH
ncbi:MAG: NifB/NifX family molybdenum-iron cluster-binding protein [Bacilli bacterium]|nr:NifB/NifX family molybdenum-iron cluster-binding protein [Bacilli bacterium]